MLTLQNLKIITHQTLQYIIKVTMKQKRLSYFHHCDVHETATELKKKKVGWDMGIVRHKALPGHSPRFFQTVFL